VTGGLQGGGAGLGAYSVDEYGDPVPAGGGLEGVDDRAHAGQTVTQVGHAKERRAPCADGRVGSHVTFARRCLAARAVGPGQVQGGFEAVVHAGGAGFEAQDEDGEPPLVPVRSECSGGITVASGQRARERPLPDLPGQGQAAFTGPRCRRDGAVRPLRRRERTSRLRRSSSCPVGCSSAAPACGPWGRGGLGCAATS
jgi:hypothetical protein